MRGIAYLLVLLLSSSCSSMCVSKEFSFYDSHGVLYRSNSAGSDVKNEYQLERNPKIILLATLSTREIKYQEQISVIQKLDAEKYQYMFVLANAEEEDRSGYYASKSVASELLNGSSFKIIIYGEHGELLRESSQVIREEKLEHHLTKSSSGR